MRELSYCPGCKQLLDSPEAPCRDCGGLWVEPWRLERLGASLPSDLKVGPSKRSCPTCRVALGAFHRPDLEVDLCTSCGGVFLDAGELERLQPAAGRPAGAEEPSEPFSWSGLVRSVVDALFER